MRLIIFAAFILFAFSSGSAYAAAGGTDRYENILPLSFGGVMLLLFVCGVCFNSLLPGFFIALVLVFGLWTAAVIRLVRRRSLKAFIRLFFTPGAVLYWLGALALLYISYGRALMIIDEFSHWGDTVKVMILYNDFGTRAAAETLYPSYPPAMALIQYFFQRVYLFIYPEYRFCEWLLSWAYGLFTLSFVMPFFSADSFRHPFKALFSFAAIFCFPLLMFSGAESIYLSLLIDPFMAVLFGCAVSALMLGGRMNIGPDVHYAYVLCAIVCMVLSKASGLLLGAAMAAAYIASFYKKSGRGFARPASALAAAFIPVLLWKLERTTAGALQSFSSKTGSVDPVVLFSAVCGRADEFHQSVFSSFWLTTLKMPVNIPGFAFPVWGLVLISVLLMLLMNRLSDAGREEKLVCRSVLAVSLVSTALYEAGLCCTYMFKFTPEEAEGLHSIIRYTYVVCLPYCLALMLSLRLYSATEKNRRKFSLAFICLALLMTNYSAAGSLAKRELVEESLYSESFFRPLADKVLEVSAEEPGRVYLLSENMFEMLYYKYQFYLRPNVCVHYLSGDAWQNYADDISGPESSLSAFEEMLFTGYDYVAVFRTDDVISQKLGGLFSEAPADDSVWRVDSENRLLVRLA